jgi:hypothetical protein
MRKDHGLHADLQHMALRRTVESGQPHACAASLCGQRTGKEGWLIASISDALSYSAEEPDDARSSGNNAGCY